MASTGENIESGSTDEASGIDRRSLIKTGAAVGAAAWVLPQVISMSPAAASVVGCVGVTLPNKITGPTTPPFTGNTAVLMGSANLCWQSGTVTVAGSSAGAQFGVDDFLAVRVTRPDASVQSLLIGSFFPLNWPNVGACPGLGAWATANLGSFSSITPPNLAGGLCDAVDITSLLQSSAVTPNTIELFVYNCGGNGGATTDLWLA